MPETLVECLECDNTATYEEAEEQDWRAVEGGIQRNIDEPLKFSGYCSKCIEKFKQKSIETGMLPCGKSKHGFHHRGSKVFQDCEMDGNILLTEEEVDKVTEKYSQRKKAVCPVSLKEGMACVKEIGHTGKHEDMTGRESNEIKGKEPVKELSAYGTRLFRIRINENKQKLMCPHGYAEIYNPKDGKPTKSVPEKCPVCDTDGV